MSGNRFVLVPGRLVDFANERWRIVSYPDGGVIRLQSLNDADEYTKTLVSELMRSASPVVQPDTGRVLAGPKPLVIELEKLRRKNPKLALWAETYFHDVLEARTGYRLGHPALALPGEPKSQYDPSVKGNTLDERLRVLVDDFRRRAANAKELGDEDLEKEFLRRDGLSTIKRHWQRYESGEGIRAFVDGRRLRMRNPLGLLDERIVAAIQRVWTADLSDGPRIRSRHIRNLVRIELNSDPDPEVAALKLPSRKTFNKHLKVLFANAALSGPTKYQRSREQMPDGEFDPAIATYPGEYVYVDVVSTNIFAFEEYTWRVVEVRELVALDAFSAAVLAARFVFGEPTGGDLVGLLCDMCWPKEWRPQWGDEAKWRAAGTPQTLVVGIKPSALVLDNAFANQGLRLLNALNILEVDVCYARLAAGEDKARLERFFLTLDDQLWQGLRLGYRGKDTNSRGRDPIGTAYWTVSELEDRFWAYVVEHHQQRPHPGIWPVGHPHFKKSPNEAFDDGLVKAPAISIPRRRDLVYQTMEPATVTIGRGGIRHRHLHYWCPELEPFKGRDAPYPAYGGKWLAFWDKDDRRFIHLQHPDTGEWWHPSARELPFANVPMAHDDVEAMRQDLVERHGTERLTAKQWDDALDAWLTGELEAAKKDASKRRAYVKRKRREAETERQQQFMEAPPSAARADQERLPVPVPREAPSGELLFVDDPELLERMAAEAESDALDDDTDAEAAA
jgi:hypothetical protein